MELPIYSAKKYLIDTEKEQRQNLEKHNSSLISKRVKPEKFKELNKTVH